MQGTNLRTPPLAVDCSDLRLLILCAGDPEGERTFSGSARNLFRALERLGCVYHKGNVTAGLTDSFSRGGRVIQMARRLDFLHIEPRYRWSRLALDANSRRGRRIATEHPAFNACLMYGTNFDPRLDFPTYCYLDATVAQVAQARLWAYQHFSERHLRKILDYQRSLFEHCRGVFPRTRWVAESLRQDFGVPEEKIHLASAGPNHYAEPLPHGPYDRRTILFVGTQWELKGGPLIVEAFRRVRRQMPDAKLVVVGCRPEIDEPGVEIVGRISKDSPGGLDRLLTLYSEASVLCIMSSFEAFGIVAVEAQNSFVPPVVPARFAFRETVVDGVTGRLVPEYDPELLSKILLEMLSDPPQLERMGRAGHEHVRANYSWDIAAQRIVERVCADLAGAKHGR
jgi:glycosyltransferase involved in cell wall biosynthesis